MEGKLIILVGISGSGKSTFAHKLLMEDFNKYALVNRDKIRELLFGFTEDSISNYYGLSNLTKLEKLVTKREDLLIKEGLAEGKTVIVDATHLEKSYIERYKYWNVPIEIKVFNITLEEAISRDKSRNRSVGEEIITRQFKKFNNNLKNLNIDFKPDFIEQDINKKKVWVFDIDGTLAHKGDRNPFDWMKVYDDSVDFPTMTLFNNIFNCGNTQIIICSGRDNICKAETERWFKDYFGVIPKIMMRQNNDSRPDWIVKEEMWRDIVKENFIVAMVDDREQVCNRARALGFKVFQVEYGNF